MGECRTNNKIKRMDIQRKKQYVKKIIRVCDVRIILDWIRDYTKRITRCYHQYRSGGYKSTIEQWKIMRDEKELFNRVNELMQHFVGKENHRHNAEMITKLFNIYNEVFSTREYSKSCGACRERVYKGLKQWWESRGGVKAQ